MAMSFAAGVAQGFGDALDDRIKYVRDRRAKTRDYLMTYGTQSVLKSKEEANKVIGIGARLEALNFPIEDINYLVDTSGPASLAAVYEQVKRFESDPSKLTPSIIKQVMQRTKDYKPSGTSYQDMVTKAFGLVATNMTDDPVQNESNAFLAAMGLDPKAGGGETYIDNYTESDIRRIMGTPAPSLTSPLSVDFGSLPKVYSPNAYQQLANTAISQIKEFAKEDFNKMKGSMDNLKDLKGADKTDYLLNKDQLERAIANNKTAEMLRLSSTARNYLLNLDQRTQSGLSDNDFFLASVPNFFSSETTKREGPKPKNITNTDAITTSDFDYLKSGYNRITAKYGDVVPSLEELQRDHSYSTEVEGLESNSNFFINKSTNKIHVSSRFNPTVNKINKTEPTDLTEQMLSLDVPDTVKGNPTLSNWDALSTNALSDLDREQKNDVTTSREVKKADTLALSSALDSVKEYLEADAKGLSNEALEAKALEMTSKIMTAPEDVQAVVMGLIQDLEDNKIPEEKESLIDKGLSFLKRVIPKKKEETILGSNDPADVVAMGKIPYTELQTIAPPPSRTELIEKLKEAQNAEAPPEETRLLKEQLIKLDKEPPFTEFVSFDNIKNELKLGNLKDGDVIKFRTEYFVVNQQGLSGPIGKVDLIRN
jgi:hypothetical protein